MTTPTHSDYIDIDDGERPMGPFSIYARRSERHAWVVMGGGNDYLDTLCRAVPLIVDVKKSWIEGQVAIGPMLDGRPNQRRNAQLEVIYAPDFSESMPGDAGVPWRLEG